MWRSDRAAGTGRTAPYATCSALQRDDRQLAAVVPLGPVGGAAIAEKAPFVGAGIEAERLERADAGVAQRGHHEPRQVELVVAVAAGREEPGVGRVLCGRRPGK